MLAIEIVNLRKVFDVGFLKKRPVVALDDLTLTVEHGTIFGFLGPNGAGKTTTLKLLMGLIYPTSGSAFILGEPISSVSVHRRIGYLPENPYFYDYLTARELVRYFGRLHDLDPGTLEARAEGALVRSGLEPAAFDRQLRKFSKGMLQRVGLAQALINDPEVVFLDEPMSGLDPVGRRQVRDLISQLRSEGVTVFFSSHILSDVEALCDRVAILNGGKLVETGRLQDILAASTGGMEIVATGVGDSGVERLRAEGFEVASTAGGLQIRVASEAEVDAALAAVRQVGGTLVAVQQTRGSLEDLFVRGVGGLGGQPAGS
jgi:ABC-2 type transport system ATP-binding protein